MENYCQTSRNWEEKQHRVVTTREILEEERGGGRYRKTSNCSKSSPDHWKLFEPSPVNLRGRSSNTHPEEVANGRKVDWKRRKKG